MSVSQETYDKAVSYYQNENKRLREALEFYGDPKRYLAWNDDGATDLELDEGLTARKALAGDKQ